MTISQQIQSIHDELPPHVHLIAVSKFHPAETIMEAYNAGQRIFGESKVQELTGKYEVLPKDIEWHFIGHLQTNKIKYIVPFVSMIHSIDSVNLLHEVNKYGEKAGRSINVLFQIHIAKEETKYGFSEEECFAFLDSGMHKTLNHLNICGLMGMATLTEDMNIVRSEFKSLHSFFKKLKQTFFFSENNFKELSMGMSDDYHEAIEEGSTLVRIGSKLFGERQYY
ncbi:MAG: YggS family pyridoxal phosphate-dependent enzyme [Candidatus Azobacteroides sp.]|nr:YggS family pyridoxal phosphate-dependent enzyme [Candidatus Azobacteroides sp.]